MELYEDYTFELGAILAAGDIPESKFGYGSRIGRSPNLKRDFESAHKQIMADYFDESPVYGKEKFERRFRMSKDLYTIFANFGDAGSLNDINTLSRSSFLKSMSTGVFKDAVYFLNGK